MEFKKVLLNKLFLSGFFCGSFIVWCLLAGFQYGQNDTLESLSQSNFNPRDEQASGDLKPQVNDGNVELPKLNESTLTNMGEQAPVEKAHNSLDVNNLKSTKCKPEAQAQGFVSIESQHVDPEWAPEFTRKLIDTFQLSDELYSLGLIKTIECKATLCEIQFDLNSSRSFDVVFQIQDAFEQTELKKHGLVFDYEEKNNMVKILIGRNDNSFEGIYQ